MLGDRIRSARELAGLSQKALGKLLNVTDAAVTHWEKERNEPDHETMRKIADATGVTVSYLRGESDETPPASRTDILLASLIQEVKALRLVAQNGFASIERRFSDVTTEPAPEPAEEKPSLVSQLRKEALADKSDVRRNLKKKAVEDANKSPHQIVTEATATAYSERSRSGYERIAASTPPSKPTHGDLQKKPGAPGSSESEPPAEGPEPSPQTDPPQVPPAPAN